VVCHVREPLANGYLGLRKWLLVWWIKVFSDKILSISRFDGGPFAGSDKLQVLYNAVDLARFNLHTLVDQTTEPDRHQDVTFLYLGGASQEKGALFLLQVWKKVIQTTPQAKLWIAGSWTNTQAATGTLTKIAQKFGIQTPQQKFFTLLNQEVQTLGSSIKIFGLQRNVELLLAKANVLLFPCQIGHFARPVLEAAFLKKPSLASYLPPLDELIINGDTGFLLPPHEISAWAEKISYLVTNPDIRLKMGQRSYQLASQKFSLAIQTKNLKLVYSRLLNKQY
jgi:glycosyltransferase involved in cell wall biosynthesis